ncbi:unnamed protein product [Cyclocybe aegerita]|uniref:Phytocyanin domain-containing protein n=1 Tax=Cyclocybe aegerita TaxID=1973307 RepID=A0A8S0X2I9_CYCAE|nr:unnamed protein product [Cyclocybe aegerita]
MVFITPFIGAAALLSGFAAALPRPDHPAEPVVTSSAAYSPPKYEAPKYEAPKYEPPKAEVSTSSVLSIAVHETTSSVAHETTTAVVHETTSTSAAHPVYTSPSYGSGASNWNNQGYNDCVQQCVASYGSLPPATYTPTATNAGVYGTGATHTVIVAPTQGVLRYIPFAVNASVGDTIKFMWGANNHTVTKSSSLQPCNRSSDALFASGTQNKDFVFTQVVNETSPTFFYCATPNHCQRGMFGIINAPNAFQAPTSVGSMMSTLAANNSNIAAYAAYTAKETTGNPAAARWGANIDMSSVPDWAYETLAENVMYTRTFLAANPEVLKEDGSVDLSAAGSTPLMIPQDLGAALNNAAAATPSAPAATTSASAAPEPSTSATGTTENLSNGAFSVSSHRVVVGLAAALVTFMMM